MTDEDLPDEEEFSEKGNDVPDDGENDAINESALLVEVSCYLLRIEYNDANDDDASEFAAVDSRSHNGAIYRPCLRQEAINVIVSIDLTVPARMAAEHAMAASERYKLKEAAADYAGNRVVNAVWRGRSVAAWRWPSIANAAEAVNTAADWLGNLVEHPIDSLSTSVGAPGSLAAAGAGVIATYVLHPITEELDEAAKIIEVVGIIIGLATGLHPLVLACVKPLAHSEIAELVADGLNHAMSPPEAHSGARPAEVTHGQESPIDRQQTMFPQAVAETEAVDKDRDRDYSSPDVAIRALVLEAQERQTQGQNARGHQRSTDPLDITQAPLSVKGPWPLVSLLPIAAISWSGQVLSRPSSRVRSPGSSTDAVALRSQTALTGSARPRTIPAAGAGTPTGTDETCCRSSGPVSCFSRQPPGVGAAVAGASAGAEACAPWRRRERPGGPP